MLRALSPRLASTLPPALRSASMLGALAPLLVNGAALAQSTPLPPLPPGVDPWVAWIVALVAGAAALPASWLAWQIAKLGAALGAGALDAAAGWIRAYVLRTPSKLDDKPGEDVARALEAHAARLRKDADDAGKDATR